MKTCGSAERNNNIFTTADKCLNERSNYAVWKPKKMLKVM